MPDNFVEGRVLEIPQNLLNKLENLDKRINLIASDSEKMATHFNSSMVRMSSGTDELLGKLNRINEEISKIGRINNIQINATNIDSFSSGLGNAATNAENAANNISRTSVAINQLSRMLKDSGVNGSMIDKILSISGKEQNNFLKELKNQVNEVSRALSRLDKQNALEAKRKENDIRIASRAESNRYNRSISNLRQESEEIRRRNAELARYTSAIVMSESTESARINKIERLKSIMQELKSNESKYSSEISVISKKIEQLTKENERLAEAKRRASRENINTRTEISAINAYNRAMASSEATMNQRINKLAKLRQAEEMLTKTGKDYSNEIKRIKAEIDRLNKANQQQASNYKRLRKEQSHLLDISGQLARKLALVFSVSQVQGYLMSIVNVTGEFEKQNTALASILQNKDKADKLFSQVTELAVKSPFQLRELITYTKSLSAYQVEYEKLFDTTKRLADVSAGLGVDMQRLILAFGQVKAANYLRGTEVRQFTEAGLNILGELSKYYSELEGRMISVGQVQEMVTKRMVSFGDVEEVFKRVTSAGGIFYKMQERQAETIAGMMSNMRDSIDIMLNDIGNSNQTTIRDAISYVRDLLQNWRDLAFAFKVAAYELSPFVAYILAAKVASTGFGRVITLIGKNLLIYSKIIKSSNAETDLFINKAKLATIWTNTWKTALKGFATIGAGFALGAIMLGIEKMIVEMTKASRQASELKEKLSSIYNSGEYEATKLSTGFRKLADTILDSSTSTDKQNESLEKLKRTYSDIIPSYKLTIEGLREMKGDYESVTRAIYDKIEAQVKEKKITAVSDTYGRDLESSSNKVKDMLQKKIGLKPEDAGFVISELRKAIEDGILKTGSDYTAFVENIIKENFKMNVKLGELVKTLAGTSLFGEDPFHIQEIKTSNKVIDEYAESLNRYNAAMEDIERPKVFPWVNPEYGILQKELEKQEKLIKDARKKIEEDNKDKGGFFISEAQIKKEKEIINQWVSDFKKGSLQIKDDYGNIVDPSSDTSIKFLEQVQKRLKEIDGNDAQKEVLSVVRAFSKLNDISLVNMKKVLMSGTQSMSEYKKNVDTEIKSIEESLEQYSKGYSGYITNIFNDKDKQKMEQTLSLLKAIQVALFPEIDKGKVGKNGSLSLLKEQIAIIKKAGEEYKKLRKYYNDDESTQKIKDSFIDSFSDIGLSIDMQFDTEGIIKGIENITNKAGEDGRKAINKAVSGLKAEVDIDLKEKDLDRMKNEIDDLFSAYEFSIELDDSGLDHDLISGMFGVDIFSLDELKKKINDMKPLFYSEGKEYIKVWDEAEKKVSKMQEDEIKRRMKKYISYLNKSISERAKIETDYFKMINEVSKSKKFDSEQKEAIIERLKKEKQQKLDALSWEEFKNSDDYIKLFEGLEFSTTSLINNMKKKLLELRSSLKDNPEYFKELISQIEKLDDILIKRNPFKYLFSKDKEKSAEAFSELSKILQEVGDTANSVASSLENVFGKMSEKANDAVESFTDVANSASELASGVERFMSGDYIGGALQFLKGFAGLIGSIFKIGDKKKEREIKKQLQLVEKLKESYEKLKEAIDSAYSIDELERGTKNMNENLKERNKALQEAIAKEGDKKKVDKERMKKMQKEIEENNKQIAENNKKLVESIGGFGSEERVKSAAEEFASAWLDSYIRVGNGLDGLKNKMNDWLKNAVQKQLLVNLSNKFITPILEQFDKMFEDSSLGGSDMLPEEAAAWKDLFEEKSKQFNEKAEEYLKLLELYGIDLRGESKDKLSGLQKGIQSITEDTAQALEAITESIRYFVSDIDILLRNLTNTFLNPPVENPFIYELRLQTEQMRIMNSLWSSLTMTKSGVSGKCLKVNII